MSGKKRRLKATNRNQLIIIITILIVGFIYVNFYKTSELILSANFVSKENVKSKEYKLTIVSNAKDRAKGLMFVKELPKNEGMLFVFPKEEKHTFWMKNTYIALDMIFLDSNQKVVGVLENVPPLNTKQRDLGLSSKYVVELNAGEAKEEKIEEGSTLVVNGQLPNAND
jgi:uncharacterized membrane protein (UPF0127 family)